MVKTYDHTLRNHLGGEGLYLSFSYDGQIKNTMVCVFSRGNKKVMFITVEEAKQKLTYYDDKPWPKKQADAVMRELNEIIGE
jgi:hypothetical protein